MEAAGGDLEAFRAGVEHWYDAAMDRVSGWYKRKVSVALFTIAAVVTVVVNLDSVTIAGSLWTDPTRRAIAAAAAHAGGRAGVEAATEALRRTHSLDLPVGWRIGVADPVAAADPRRFPWPRDGGWPRKLLGLGVTTTALSFGAPFWFDVLGHVARLRSSGEPPPGKP